MAPKVALTIHSLYAVAVYTFYAVYSDTAMAPTQECQSNFISEVSLLKLYCDSACHVWYRQSSMCLSTELCNRPRD
jgi:hypothetical protein